MMSKGDWEEVHTKRIFLWPWQLQTISSLRCLFSWIATGSFSLTWSFTKVRWDYIIEVPSLAMNYFIPIWFMTQFTHHRFSSPHSSSLKNSMVWDVRMFQETKCMICKKKITPRRDELCLQFIKDFWMKHLQRAWKAHWVSWRDSSRNNCGNGCC